MLYFKNSDQRLAYEQRHPIFGEHTGPLQKQLLTEGEFSMFAFAPMIEGNFVEVNKRMKLVDQLGDPSVITVALATINIASPKPDTMLLAMQDNIPSEGKDEQLLKLKRLYPLKLVKLRVENETNCILRVAVAKRGVFYIELLTEGADDERFGRWVKLINLLNRSPDVIKEETDEQDMRPKKTSKIKRFMKKILKINRSS
ncbi:Golgi-associated RAB2B interactor protein 3-like [Mixophyes fleayi]|uniref:Golgi-associated RAB2B interactor protein 3-like n=1 Tax=Mixophyes fleayi TaxID=3061075 RepID=UPI003F4DCEF9